MLKPSYTRQFERDLKKCLKRGKDEEKIKEVHSPFWIADFRGVKSHSGGSGFFIYGCKYDVEMTIFFRTI